MDNKKTSLPGGPGVSPGVPGSKADEASANRIREAASAHKNDRPNNRSSEDGEEKQGNEKGGSGSREEITQKIANTTSEALQKGMALPKIAADKAGEKIANSNPVQKSLDNAEPIIDKSIKIFKLGKILSMMSPFIPTILTGLAIIFVILIIFAQVVLIKDNIREALGEIYETGERFTNFISGHGWNTSEEDFFVNLKLAAEDFQGSDNLDIPLIASAIHYSYYVDVGTFDGENDHDEEVKSDDNLDTDESIFGSFVESQQTHKFYVVANTKLGEYGMYVRLGKKGLLGHLIYTKITFEKSYCKFWDAVKGWVDFFKNYFDFTTTSFSEVLSANDNSYFEAIMYELSRIFTLNGLLDFVLDFPSFFSKVDAFAANGQNYMSWELRNFAYELKEFFMMLKGEFDDADLMASPEAYYNTLPGSGTEPSGPGFENTTSFYEAVSEDFGFIRSEGRPESESDISNNSNYTERDKDNARRWRKYYVPQFHNYNDYKGFYRYLVNVYVPETYFYGKTLNVNYTYSDLIKIANDIFDEKYLYDHLLGDKVDRTTSSCTYDFAEDGEKTNVNVTVDMLNNMYVNVLEYGETNTISGSIAETVSLKDYVAGVAYREISAKVDDDDDYLTANIVAIKSYTLGRRTITEKDGKYYITMKNSTYDQVYCSVTKGCLDATSNRKPAPSSELLQKLGSLYESTLTKALYNGSKFVGSYRDTLSRCVNDGYSGQCMGQIDSKRLAVEENLSWQSILATFYTRPIGLIDISSGDFVLSARQCVSDGLTIGEDGYFVRTSKPTQADKYFNPPFLGTGNIGQCAWYAKGRAMEIIANSRASQALKDELINKIRVLNGNGADWTTNGMCSIFKCSTDYTKPHAGSLVAYYATSDYMRQRGWPVNYGHVVVVEQVIGDQVVVTDGWNSGGANGGSSWANVQFRNRTVPISYMRNFGGNYIFRGYVYLLG